MSDKRTWDVFISHAAADVAVALEVSKAFRAHHLEPFVTSGLPAGTKVSDIVWEALAESRALIVIVPTSGPPPNMGIEIGAASAWNKPVFGIISDPSVSQSPWTAAEIPVYTFGRIEEVIQKVKECGAQFSSADIAALVGLYSHAGEPVDQFAMEPKLLSDLTKGFRKETGKAIPGERLLSELLRLRKRGQLPKMQNAAHVAS